MWWSKSLCIFRIIFLAIIFRNESTGWESEGFWCRQHNAYREDWESSYLSLLHWEKIAFCFSRLYAAPFEISSFLACEWKHCLTPFNWQVTSSILGIICISWFEIYWFIFIVLLRCSWRLPCPWYLLIHMGMAVTLGPQLTPNESWLQTWNVPSHLYPAHPVQVLIRLLTTHPLHPSLFFFQYWELPSC